MMVSLVTEIRCRKEAVRLTVQADPVGITFTEVIRIRKTGKDQGG